MGQTNSSNKTDPKCSSCHELEVPQNRLDVPLSDLKSTSVCCHVCHAICKAINTFDTEWLEARQLYSYIRITSGKARLDFQVYTRDTAPLDEEEKVTSKWVFHLALHIFVKTPAESPWNALSVHCPIASNSGSDQCLQRIRSWLRACDAKHKLCSSFAEPGTDGDTRMLSAARIIDLGDDAKNTLAPRLIPIPKVYPLRWSALSYCWGGESSFVTTKSNLEERMRGISQSSIPATLRDAMILSARLGVRYVWIDALCIIQDLPEDLNTEASKMEDIFRNAYFVIAADLGGNPHSGIFVDRQRYSVPIEVYLDRISEDKRGAKLQEKQTIFVEIGSGKDYTYLDAERGDPEAWYTGATLRHVVLEENSRHKNRRWSNPTFLRAWCFQERLLATRIIHFTSAELIWECKETIRCECELRDGTNSTLKQTLDWFMASELGGQHHTPLEVSQMWWKLIKEFSRCDVTVRADRLPAISGLARMFPMLGTYCAGMWSGELPVSLIWRESPDENTSLKLSDEYVAPSWSWASATQAVNEPDWYGSELLAKVIKIEATTAGPDTYGRVLNGTLTISGPIADAKLRYITDPVMKDPFVHLRIFLDGGSVMPDRDYDRLSFLPDYRILQGYQQPGIVVGEALCIAIKSGKAAEDSMDTYQCLVVRPSPVVKGTYERVGTVHCLSWAPHAFSRTRELRIV